MAFRPVRRRSGSAPATAWGFSVRHRLFRQGVSCLAAAAVTLASVSGPLRAQSVSNPVTGFGGLSRSHYEACQAQDEITFRRAVEAVTIDALGRGTADLDYKGLVSEEWRRARIDEIVNREVDTAVEAVRGETSFARLMESIINPETAREIATPVAERVYRSEAMKQAMEQLAAGVGRELGRRIEIAAAGAGRPAASCIEAFLGSRYGSTVAKVVSNDALRAFGIDPETAAANVTPGSVAVEGSGVIAGAVIVIVRRELATLANRILQRLLGIALGRVASSVIGGIGLVLIAKDVWDFRHGVMPIIADEMKSPATREKVQVELVRAIREQVGGETRDIGLRTAERVVEIWLEFRRAHLKVLELAEADPAFKRVLETVRPERLRRLDEAVALILADPAGKSIEARLADGSLQKAMETLGDAAFQVGRDLRSLDAAFAWQVLAGDLLPRIVEDELHRRNRVEAFTRQSLAGLLALGDKPVAGRLAALDPVARDTLLELPGNDVRALTRGLSDAELRSLARYLGALDKPIAARLLQAVAARPVAMQILAPDGVREAALRSRDPGAAIDLLLRPDSTFDFSRVLDDLTLVRDGRIEPRVLLARHPMPLGLAAFGCLLVLSLFWRMLFGRRRPAPGPDGAARA